MFSARLLATVMIAVAAPVAAFAQVYPSGPVYPPRPVGPPVFADELPPGYILGEERLPGANQPSAPAQRIPDDRPDLTARQGAYGAPSSAYPSAIEAQPLPPPVFLQPDQLPPASGPYGSIAAPERQLIVPPGYSPSPAPGPYGSTTAPDHQAAVPPGYGAPPREGETMIYRPPADVSGAQQAIISALPPEERPETGPAKALPLHLKRQLVNYRTKEPAGTLIVDTQNTYLYLVLGNGQAIRYGIGVGRQGFTWSGQEKISKMAEWPDWTPPDEMVERQPYLPRFMAGGPGNPLGARALYLGKSIYRIHGTNQPSTIGTFVSSGCIRLLNEDVEDLYQRVQVGTRVVVLPGQPPSPGATAASGSPASAMR